MSGRVLNAPFHISLYSISVVCLGCICIVRQILERVDDRIALVDLEVQMGRLSCFKQRAVGDGGDNITAADRTAYGERGGRVWVEPAIDGRISAAVPDSNAASAQTLSIIPSAQQRTSVPIGASISTPMCVR